MPFFLFLYLEILGDLGVVEVVHFIDHPDGRVDDREGTEGTSTLTESQT